MKARARTAHHFRCAFRIRVGEKCGLARASKVAVFLVAAALPASSHGQDVDGPKESSEVEEIDPLEALRALEALGSDATATETEAWNLAETGRYIKARELAERIVKRNRASYVGHLVLGHVQHYGEANFPRALYHLDEAYRLFTVHHGEPPRPGAPWRWHARLLRELAMTHGDLEHHAEKVAFLAKYNEIYDPDMLADRAWPLMKLGHYKDARRAAREGIESGDPREMEIALNALCAIEFEAGHDGASYIACKRALEHARATSGSVNAVDLTNFAEASRSLFKLDEAEQILLEATEAGVAWYGSPWVELADLYVREGRYAEALHALQEVPPYRAQRPPHVQDADRNEARRALAAFFVVIGRPWDAVRITDKALVMPDRRAHNSRDPAQDRAIIALLDRRARRMAAEMVEEKAASGTFWDRVVGFGEASWLRLQAWSSGRQAGRLVADPKRLVGIFRLGTADSAILPPWLAGELVDIAGPGVIAEAVRGARRRDDRPGSGAYYDAVAAEAALSMGDEERAIALVEKAEARIGRAEALLLSRLDAIAAEAARSLGSLDRAAPRYDAAFQRDPGVFRRLGLSVPVRFKGVGGEVAEAIRDALARSPRLDDVGAGLTVRIEADPSGGRACLVGSDGSVLGCGEAEAGPGDDLEALVTKVVDDFHAAAFAPRVDLSQADANSLDGSNRVGRNPLEGVVGGPSADDF